MQFLVPYNYTGNVECAAENLPVLTCARWQPQKKRETSLFPPASIPKLLISPPELKLPQVAHSASVVLRGSVRCQTEGVDLSREPSDAREGFVAVPSCSHDGTRELRIIPLLARRAPSHSQR